MLDILLIGAGLSMDALAVSVANSLAVRRGRFRLAAVTAALFGFFQGLMPMLGWFLGSAVSGVVSAWGPYICFFLLAFTGARMIVEALSGGSDGTAAAAAPGPVRLAVMAVATSLDAFSVGVSFAFMRIELLPACFVIALETFAICLAGGLVGSRVPGLSCKAAGVLGGCVLCAIGLRLLLEGVGVI